MTREELVKRGRTRDAERGVETVTVPGALAGWDALLKKYGTITLAQALEPAIGYAENGYRRHAGHRRRLGEARQRCSRATPARRRRSSPNGARAEGRRLVPKSRSTRARCADREGRHRRRSTAARSARSIVARSAAARRLPHARRSEEERADVGDADLDDVQGLSRLGAAAEQPGHRRRSRCCASSTRTISSRWGTTRRRISII